MQKNILKYTFPFFLFIIFSCKETVVQNQPVEEKGTLFITSNPVGAQIFLDGINTGKITPNTLVSLNPGAHNITLDLNTYSDTAIIYNVIRDQSNYLFVQFPFRSRVQTFGPVRIYETFGASALQPAGLDLSSGNAYDLASVDKDKVDIFYSSIGYIVRSANGSSGMTRVTLFKVGSGTYLNDGVDSDLATGSWLTKMTDRETNYVFLFDNDSHYTKIKIKNWGGGTPGDPAWVEVQWLYNNTINDRGF